MNTENIITNTPSLNYSSSKQLAWSTIFRYLLIILILSFLGINLFTYLGNITEYIFDIIKPIVNFFGYTIAETTKTTINLSATGSKGLIDAAAGSATGGIDLLEKGLGRKQIRNNIDNNQKMIMDNILSRANISNPVPDDAGSLIQSTQNKSKSGYCYIGEDRGFRSCIQVGEGDICMSGDIFPTQEICVNPSLRN
jgi:hypothetical protein